MTMQPNEAMVEIAPGDNVLSALYDRAAASPSSPALLVCRDAAIDEITVAEMVGRVRSIAAGIVAAGIEPGDRVVIFSHPRAEWALVDYAIWQAGGVVVTIYETSSPDQVEWILQNSGAKMAFVEDDALAEIVDATGPNVPSLETVIRLADGGLDEFVGNVTVDDDVLDRRAATLQLDQPATIVYTSGTTGRPKGCVVTHLNLIWTIRQVMLTEPDIVADGNRTLTFLPLAHILARVVQLAAITAGVPVAFGGGIRTLLGDLAVVKPTWLTVVPRVLEKVHDGAAQKAGTGVKRAVFDRADGVARSVGEHRMAGRPVPLHLRVAHRVADAAVFRSVRDAMGGQLRWVISGGAPLHPDLARFFSGVGVEVLEGYGLTETTGPATVHRVGGSKPGTVGPPLAGVDVRISDEGEIQLAGNCVFAGYWDNDEATTDAFADEYFRTGDFGEVDADGHVVITGRMKDLIVTAGGKNIAPVPLETAIAAHPLISHAVVVGDNRPFVSALLTLDLQALGAWATQHDRQLTDPGRLVEELSSDPDLIEELQGAIDAAGASVSRAEGVRAFRVLPTDLSVEDGDLTPTMKVRRANVIAKYDALVRDIYG
jgi:long-chain acyl-CoA synthetase